MSQVLEKLDSDRRGVLDNFISTRFTQLTGVKVEAPVKAVQDARDTYASPLYVHTPNGRLSRKVLTVIFQPDTTIFNYATFNGAEIEGSADWEME